MKIRLLSFGLFLLAFLGLQLPLQPPGGYQMQLGADCCRGRRLWGGVAAAASSLDSMPRKSNETHKGNELENEKKLRVTTKQTVAVIGDITTTAKAATLATLLDAATTTTSTATLADKSKYPQLIQHGLKQVKELNFKQKLSRLLHNDEALSTVDSVDIDLTTLAERQLQQHSPHHQTDRRHIVPDKLQYTKEIQIKQGRLVGIIRRFQVTSGLHEVDQYLGLPYAEAPTGSRRFMPPGAPLPWQGLKIAHHLPPVCPQKLPDLSKDGNANMSRGRYKHLQRLLPYLKTESEDCLYLNLYVPHESLLSAPTQYPVLVYLHGESFEWNSGNAYDGSVLASYGEVIVVTINYRLGVLGFLRPSIDEHNIANYALLDQIAALHWIKENIASFGGDNSRVTLMGHSTGAACVNYLMVSPVASGLFHRAILMSGSAMSDWAASNQTLQLTMQIANALDCPLNANTDDDDALLECLRQRR